MTNNKSLRRLYKELESCNNCISNTKKELSNGDYKIIKCMESSLINKDMPYDIDELTSHRNELRSIINTKEEERNNIRSQIKNIINNGRTIETDKGE